MEDFRYQKVNKKPAGFLALKKSCLQKESFTLDTVNSNFLKITTSADDTQIASVGSNHEKIESRQTFEITKIIFS